jgi:glycine/D-amino acid oxidase-like deaminating enzyme
MSLHKAVRTPEDLPASGWYRLLPPPGPPRILEGRHSADFIIVGAGFAGLSAARRLTQLAPNARIVVLDAQRVGWGAAGRNSGFMIDLPHELSSETYAGGDEHDRKRISMNRSAIAFAASAAEEYGLEPFFRPVGKLHGAATAHGLGALRDFEVHLSRLGEAFERLDAADMKRITGTGFYVGGTFTPGTVMIQPAGYVRGLATGVAARVELYENSPALSVETGKLHTVRTKDGEVSAPRLILTVNGHIESFGYFRRRLMHVFTYASMTGPLSEDEQLRLGGDPHWGLVPADPMGTTVRRIGDRIVIRNTFTYNPDMTTSAPQIETIGRAHDRSFRARFPMLDGVAMETRWGGHLCLSLNSVPAFGEVEERVYAACCCNGLGTVQGTLYGTLAAELATGSDDRLVADALKAPPPARLHPEPIMAVGAPLRLWMMHRRAGREL